MKLERLKQKVSEWLEAHARPNFDLNIVLVSSTDDEMEEKFVMELTTTIDEEDN